MIGIISDIHDNVYALRVAAEILKEKGVDLVVHCGDTVSPLTLGELEGLNVKMIFGNCDGERQGLSQAAEKMGFEEITEVKEFTYKGKKFFVCHGKNKALLAQKIASQQYDYILTGHTHVQRDEEVGKTRIINPGSMYLGDDVNTIALLNPEKDILEIVHIGQ
jgi:uncharacterized protein